MGLDVYLYTREQREQNERYDALCERAYADGVTDERRKEILAEGPGWVRIDDIPSERYPDHYFNRRYLRSSYNDVGFNRAVPEMIGDPTANFEGIFTGVFVNQDFDGGTVREEHIEPLRAAKGKALDVAARIRSAELPLRIMTAYGLQGSADHLWSEPPTPDEVLEWARGELAKGVRDYQPGDGYSNAKGLVFPAGTEIVAVTTCRGRGLFHAQAEAAIVFRQGDEARESYAQSAEIIAEFCDEAIALIERDGSAYVSWSG